MVKRGLNVATHHLVTEFVVINLAAVIHVEKLDQCFEDMFLKL